MLYFNVCRILAGDLGSLSLRVKAGGVRHVAIKRIAGAATPGGARVVLASSLFLPPGRILLANPKFVLTSCVRIISL